MTQALDKTEKRIIANLHSLRRHKGKPYARNWGRSAVAGLNKTVSRINYIVTKRDIRPKNIKKIREANNLLKEVIKDEIKG